MKLLFSDHGYKIVQKGKLNSYSANSPYFSNNINKALLKLKSRLLLSMYAYLCFSLSNELAKLRGFFVDDALANAGVH